MAITGSQKAYKHARAGVLRAGTARANYFSPIVPVLTISGANQSTNAIAGSFRVALNLFDQPDYLTGRCQAAGGFSPQVGNSITLGIGEANNRVFNGRIQALTQLYVAKPSISMWDILAIDSTDLLNKRLVRKRYVNVDASVIVLDIIATYVSGITVTGVESGIGTIDDITFTMERPADCLTRLAAIIPGCRWYVDEYQVLWFGTTIPATPAPASLTNTASVPFRNVQLRRDISQIRTRAYVEGRGGQMSEFQASFGASPDVSVDTPSEIFADPSDYGGGTFYVRWKTLVLGYTDVDDTGFDHLVGVIGNTSLYNASNEERPREGDDVNQWVQRDDTSAQTALAALEGGDGIREMYIQDRRLSYDGALSRGDEELAANSTYVDTLIYETTDVNARPGRDVVVSLTGDFALAGTYRIQTVTIDAIGSVTTKFPWRRVEAVSATQLNLWDVMKKTNYSPTFMGLGF